jgi:hypothetical protein
MLTTTLSILGLAIAYSIIYDYFLFRLIQTSRSESSNPLHKSRGA